MNAREREMMPEGLERGLEILRENRGGITWSGGGYNVPDGPETYQVSRTPTGVLRCSCGASCGPSEEHGETCSHMWTAMLRDAERVAEYEARWPPD